MQRFLPTLVSIFQAPPDKTPLGINAVSIEYLKQEYHGYSRYLCHKFAKYLSQYLARA